MAVTTSDQSNSRVGGDQAGRDIVHNAAPRPSSQVSRLLKKLAEQIANNDRSAGFVESLQYFVNNPEVMPMGLKEKLEKAGRGDRYEDALARKEMFSKLLLKYETFSSAQELFAYMLSIVHDVFSERIVPFCEHLNTQQIDSIVDQHIIDKLFEEIGDGSDVVTINRMHVRGMIYWLADRCFIRWHK